MIRPLLALALALYAAPVCAAPTVWLGGKQPLLQAATPAVAPPALPLAAGARLMGYCDSETGYALGIGTSTAGNYAYYRPSNVLSAAWEANPNFNFDSWYDAASPFAAGGNPYNGAMQGLPGDHLDWTNNGGSNPAFVDGAMSRARYAVTRNPDIVFINCGTNTLSSGDSGGAGSNSATYVKAKLDQLVNIFTSRGKWVVLSTLYPRADWPSGDARHQMIRDVNTWIRAQAGRTGVKVFDPYALLVSPTDPDGIDTTMFQDTVHLSVRGASLTYSTYLKPVLATMIAPGTVFSQDATVSNLVPSSLALLNGGTAGTKAGSYVTGTVATGLSFGAERRNTSTAVASVVDSGAGYSSQVVAINTADTVNRYSTWYLNFTAQTLASPIPANSWFRAYLHVNQPDTQSCALVNASGFYSGAFGWNANNEVPSSFFDAPQVPGRGDYWIATPPAFTTTALAQMGAYVRIYCAGGVGNPAGSTPIGTATFKFDRFIVRTSADPRGAWNLP